MKHLFYSTISLLMLLFSMAEGAWAQRVGAENTLGAGNAAGAEKQKKSGKQTARERVAMLLDGGSFVEQAMLLGDAGVVTGCGTVEGTAEPVSAKIIRIT